MRFCFIDRVVSHDRGVGITVSKGVSYAEPFLADHFPGAPVLPGAMMVEGAVEAAMWYMRVEGNFPMEDYLVSEIRQGKFSKVVRPGDVLTISVTVDQKRATEGQFPFRARGTCEGERVFSARFTLTPQKLTANDIGSDRQIACLQGQKELWSLLNAAGPN